MHLALNLALHKATCGVGVGGLTQEVQLVQEVASMVVLSKAPLIWGAVSSVRVAVAWAMMEAAKLVQKLAHGVVWE